MAKYDEDLSQNTFFSALCEEHRDVILEGGAGGWLICVPRAEVAPKPPLSDATINAHVLKPSENNNNDDDTLFNTLCGREVKWSGDSLTFGSGSGERTVNVLFEETFYEEGIGRYKVLCVEESLHVECGVDGITTPPPPLVTVSSLRECLELLWSEGGDKVIRKVDLLIEGFHTVHPHLEDEEVSAVREGVTRLYTEALHVFGVGEEVGEEVKVALESYILHGLHSRIISCIATHQTKEDAKFNLSLKALCDLQPSDLGLAPEVSGNLITATLELSSLGDHTTPLGKLGCLKRAVGHLGRQAGVLTSDLLLPALVVVVVRAALPNWPVQLSFLRLFHLSSSGDVGSEYDFYLSSLEAALQHIASGELQGEARPEADSVLGCSTPSPKPEMSRTPSIEEDMVMRYFECVRLGLVEEVQDLLKQDTHNHTQEEENKSPRDLCHPLCACEKCEDVFRQPQRPTYPTTASEDSMGRTGLHLACMFGRPAVVDLLVSEGAPLEARDQRGATPLHYASQRGHQNALLLLLHAGADMNSVDGENNTPLHLAALHGHQGCVKAFLFYAESVGKHIEVNCQNTVLDTPLHLAARWGHLAIVNLLLDRLVTLRLPLTLTNRRRLTPIECSHNQLIVRAILEARAKALCQEVTSGYRMGSDVVAHTHPVATLHLKAPIETSQSDNTTKMLKAVRVGDERLACFYLGIDYDSPQQQQQPQPNTQQQHESTTTTTTKLCHPLCQCVQCVAKSPRGIHKATYTVEINACDKQGHTALHLAVAAGHTKLATLLLHHGADPNVQTQDQGVTPLHLAARGYHTHLIRELAQHGATLDLQDVLGNTPLHICCATGQGEAVALLLRMGATQGVSNLAGRSPIQEAEEYGHWWVVGVLLGKGTTSPQ